MEKLTVNKFAEKFGISKQAVYKRIKKKTVEVELINGVQFILVENSKTKSSQNKTNKKGDGGEEFFSFLLSENDQLKKDLRNKEHELKEKNDKIEAIYQQVITVQNKNIALQDENRLLIEQKSTHPISTGYDGIVVDHGPSSEPIREQKQKGKKKKDKKKAKGDGKRSKLKKKFK